jgi:hypothetical protein
MTGGNEMRRFNRMRLLMLGISAGMFATDSSADAGVPMLFVTFPSMLLALVPIVLVEAVVLGWTMGRKAASFLKAATIANVASTVAGIPLTWLVLVLLEWITGGGSAYGLGTPLQKFLAVTWQAPWLLPYERQLYWMIPAASLFLPVPFFFTSYLIEAPIVARIKRELPAAQVRAAVFRANLASYTGLVAFNVWWLVWALHHAPKA